MFLLLHIGSSDPSGWIYNSISDRWSNGTIGYKVTGSTDDHFGILAKRGLTRGAAIALTQCGLGAGLQQVCDRCHGTREIAETDGYHGDLVTCPECGGSGYGTIRQCL